MSQLTIRETVKRGLMKDYETHYNQPFHWITINLPKEHEKPSPCDLFKELDTVILIGVPYRAILSVEYNDLADHWHYHMFIQVDMSQQTLRERLKKVFSLKKQVTFTTKEHPDPIEAIAYVLKGGDYGASQEFDKKFIELCKSISYEKLMSLQEARKILKAKLLDGRINEDEFVREFYDAPRKTDTPSNLTTDIQKCQLILRQYSTGYNDTFIGHAIAKTYRDLQEHYI